MFIPDLYWVDIVSIHTLNYGLSPFMPFKQA
jgi:hypothetical protein